MNESFGPSVPDAVLSPSHLLGPGSFQDPSIVQVAPSSGQTPSAVFPLRPTQASLVDLA